LTLNLLFLLGLITILISRFRGIFEFDLKKIIALSTLSQLGLIVACLGLGIKALSIFHLLTHAFFKSLLFLCAGVLIHRLNNFQDIRFIGRIIKFFPFSYRCLIVSNLSLMGIFFIAGFYSKDIILEIIRITKFNYLIYFLMYLRVILTIFYSIRLIFYLFINYKNNNVLMNYYEEDNFILLRIFILIILSIIRGRYFK
jgi:NADH-ubiquinone oxidoreductase chain 5